MGKEFVVIRQRIERERMQNRWFYVTSLIAALGIMGWIVGTRVIVFNLRDGLKCNNADQADWFISADDAREWL
jgi:hypothetical protein